jgi:hypothetical protein
MRVAAHIDSNREKSLVALAYLSANRPDPKEPAARLTDVASEIVRVERSPDEAPTEDRFKRH